MSWNQDLTDFVEEVADAVDVSVRRVAQTAFERIVERTPVDTGLAKASWVLDMDTSDGIVDVEIYNDVPYIIFLEYGSSDQAPHGMVEITLQEIADEVFR